MTKATYFIRTKKGEKGPYTLREIKAAFADRSVSADAECRRSDTEEWQPIRELLARVEQASAKKRKPRATEEPSRVDEAIEREEQAAKERRVAPIAFVLSVLLLGLYFYVRSSQRLEGLGKPCSDTGACPSGATCLLPMDANRNIDYKKSYCTIACNDHSDCGGSMHCGTADEIGPQGAQWDGMSGGSRRVCLRR